MMIMNVYLILIREEWYSAQSISLITVKYWMMFSVLVHSVSGVLPNAMDQSRFLIGKSHSLIPILFEGLTSSNKYFKITALFQPNPVEKISALPCVIRLFCQSYYIHLCYVLMKDITWCSVIIQVIWNIKMS